jgi:hypothetical protein
VQKNNEGQSRRINKALSLGEGGLGIIMSCLSLSLLVMFDRDRERGCGIRTGVNARSFQRALCTSCWRNDQSRRRAEPTKLSLPTVASMPPPTDPERTYEAC